MDFITDLPASRHRLGAVFDSILVIMDRFTKMALYIPVTKTITADELAQVFIESVTTRYGNPQTIVSDRGSVFTSRFWSTLCTTLRIKNHLSTAFHPQTDGQTERQNQTLEQYLRSYVNYQQDDWVSWLPLAAFSYNNSVHAETHMTPFMALMGYNPSVDATLAELIPSDSVPAVDLLVNEMAELQEALKEGWAQAVRSQAKYYDPKRQHIAFATGDWVYLNGRNIRTKRPTKKLDYKWLGPFQIIEPVGKQAYRLELPDSAGRLHPVFNVSLLSPAKFRNGTSPETLPTLEIDGETEWFVDSIIRSRIRAGQRQYLVHWAQTDHTLDSWEPEEYVKDTTAFDKFLARTSEQQNAAPNPTRQRRRRQQTTKRHRN